MCTLERRGRVYHLTLTGAGDEHRLNPDLLDAITASLANIRSDLCHLPSAGAALVTSAEGKFFSNGLDLAWIRTSPSSRLPLLGISLQRAIASLLTLPIPTIAAVTGHAAAAGVGLVLAHDYVLMRADRGFLYMSEVDRGLPIRRYFMALVRSKIAHPRARRDVLLRGARVGAAQAVEMGIVDRALGGAKETLEAALELGEELAGRDWDGRVYSSIRRAAFPEAFHELSLVSDPVVDAMMMMMSRSTNNIGLFCSRRNHVEVIVLKISLNQTHLIQINNHRSKWSPCHWRRGVKWIHRQVLLSR